MRAGVDQISLRYRGGYSSDGTHYISFQINTRGLQYSRHHVEFNGDQTCITSPPSRGAPNRLFE